MKIFKSINVAEENFENSLIDVKFLIIHYTAGDFKRVKEIFEDNSKKVSCHFIIDVDGKIYEVVECLNGHPKKAYHAGISNYNGLEDLNNHSIGIELVNFNGNFVDYTEDQYYSLIELTCELKRIYPVLNSQKWILGHEEISGLRGKADPGIKFNWNRYLVGVFGQMSNKIIKNQVDGEIIDMLKSIVNLDSVNSMAENQQYLFWHILSYSTEYLVKEKNQVNVVLCNFEIVLGVAYYKKGIINPGVLASEHLGQDGVPITLNLPNGITLQSTINRNANSNHSVRAYFGNDLIEFMQQNYKFGDVLKAVVKPKNVIEIL